MSQPNIPPQPNARRSDGAAQPPETPPQRGAENQANENATAVIDDLEALRMRALSAEQERDQFLALLQRTRADFENYQKRTQRDLDQERRFWHKPLAAELLPVLDNLQRATAAAKQAGESGPLVQGVAMVQSQILDLLKRHGITPIEALGKPFDPNHHQAVMQQPSANNPPGTVLQVLEQGFMIHDRVLRPASVVVSTAPIG
jgi:molecular chaperone GrpE